MNNPAQNIHNPEGLLRLVANPVRQNVDATFSTKVKFALNEAEPAEP